MAIVKAHAAPRVIDLSGPDGNAFALLGQARAWGKQLGWSPERIKALQEEMTSGDYDNLVQVMDREFGSFCTFILPDNGDDDEE